MATRYAVANGNWSDVATWDGGASLPGVGDDVYADGKTVAIDQNITVTSIRTDQRSGGTIGGGFTCNTSRTITANIIGGSNDVLVISGNSLNITIIGIIRGGTANSNGVTINGNTQNIIIYGNIYGGSNSSHGVYFNATGSLTCHSNIYGGTGFSSYGIYNYGILYVYGNVYGGTYKYINYALNTTHGIVNCNTITLYGQVYGGQVSGLNVGFPCGILNYTSNSIITIIGNQIQKMYCASIFNYSSGIVSIIGDINCSYINEPYSSLYCFNNSSGSIYINGNIQVNDVAISNTLGIITNNSNGLISITGNVVAGTVLNAMAIVNASTGNIYVDGSVTGGSNTTTYAIYSTTAGTIEITKDCIAGTVSPAVFSSSVSAINIVKGNIINKEVVALYCFKLFISENTPQTITLLTNINKTDRLFFTSNAITGFPLTSDVRDGVLYGAASELEGELIVPPPSSVALNVPTDNTVGTLVPGGATAADVWDYLLTAIATPGSIGDLIKTNLDGQISDIPADVVTEFNISLVDVAVRMQNASTVDTTGNQLAALP